MWDTSMERTEKSRVVLNVVCKQYLYFNNNTKTLSEMKYTENICCEA
jgi:hypothetical protein